MITTVKQAEELVKKWNALEYDLDRLKLLKEQK